MDRSDKSLEIGPAVSHGGRPEYPVGLGICLAAVQRQSVFILLRQVIGDFRLSYLVREDVEIQKLVPYEIVFLAPGAGLVKCQAVMVTVTGHLYPLAGKLAGLCQIRLGNVVLSEHIGHVSV